MFKNKVSVEVKVGERLYQFMLDHDSPLQEFIDVMGIVSKNTQEALDDALASQKEKLKYVPAEECAIEG